MEENSVIVFNQLKDLMNELREGLPFTSDPCPAELLTEFANVYLFYEHVEDAKTEITAAMEKCGMETEMIGALGKRTKYQENNLAQLTFKIKLSSPDSEASVESVESVEHLPQDVNLNDEVRLDRVKFENDSEVHSPVLGGSQQAVILAALVQLQKSQPKDELSDEELLPIITTLLSCPRVWCIQSAVLLLRCKLEAHHKRTVERAMSQLQILADSFDSPAPSAHQRLHLFFLSLLQPCWAVRARLADTLVSLGCVKTALDLYLDLRDWEGVVLCYSALQLRHKAREVIEAELSKQATPKLYCLLGDNTDDVGCYEKAWDLSQGRSARAQRHWANYLYTKQEYAASIPHLELSLKVNSLQKELWYKLGFAALHEEKWELSASAYRRYVALDSERFEAWNNLARCYCELDQPRRAFYSLLEAVKVDYSNWRVWANLMFVASCLGEFEESMRAYHRVLDMKDKHVDIPVLQRMVRALSVEEGQKDGLRSKLLALFGRLTAQIQSDAEVWTLYAQVPDATTRESLPKIHSMLVKAHRAGVNRPGWEKEVESGGRVVQGVVRLGEVSLQLNERAALTSFKMAAVSVSRRIKDQHPGTEMCDLLDLTLSQAQQALENLSPS